MLRPLIALALALSPVALPAQDSTATQLDTVVVSASKTSGMPLSQAVTIITGAELRQQGIARVSDALRLVPGVAIVASGAVGSVTSLFLRGGESRYSKVLIDGVAVNAVGGYFDFSHLTTDNVDRIEIVRGPGSVVYGADAMTGVVHVFTRRGGGVAAAEVDARAGSYGTREIGTAVRGGAGHALYSLAAARFLTDGILPFNNQYDNGTLSGSLRVTPDQMTTVQLSSRYGDARYHYPTDFVGAIEDSNSFRDQRRLTVALDATRRIRENFELHFLAGSNGVTDVTDDIDPPPPWVGGGEDVHSRFRARTDRRSAELRGTYRLPTLRAALTTGAEYVRERERTVSFEGAVGTPLAATSDFAGTRTTGVAFAEVSGFAGRVDYVLSGRLDRPSDFGRFATYRIGIGSTVAGVRLRASAGTAFNAPAFSQLLPTAYTVGSPDLDPERARSIEAGLDWTILGERVRLGVTRFDQRFLGLIQYVSGGPPDFLGSYANLARARSTGWELESRVIPVPGWVVMASFTRLTAVVDELDARYEGDLQVGQPLLRRPSRSATAALTHAGAGRGTAAVAVRYIGSRPDLDFREFPSPLVQLPSYTVVDAAAGWRVFGDAGGTRLLLTARLENAFDRRYEEVLYYAAPGRTILLGGQAVFSR